MMYFTEQPMSAYDAQAGLDFGATALKHMWASGSTVVHRSQGHWMRLSLCRIPEHRFGPIRIGKREVDRTMHEHGVEPIDRDPASELSPSARSVLQPRGSPFPGVRVLAAGDTLSA